MNMAVGQTRAVSVATRFGVDSPVSVRFSAAIQMLWEPTKLNTMWVM